MIFLLRINTWFLFAQFLLSAGLVLAASDGKLRIELVDEQTRETLPARIELLTTRGRPVRSRGLGVGQLGDHFYLSGSKTR